MAAESGYINIFGSGTMADMVENPTANLGFSTTATTKKLLGCD